MPPCIMREVWEFGMKEVDLNAALRSLLHHHCKLLQEQRRRSDVIGTEAKKEASRYF